MYLTVFGAAGPIFMFCSFWAYHYVKMDVESMELDTDDMDVGSSSMYLKPITPVGNF